MIFFCFFNWNKTARDLFDVHNAWWMTFFIKYVKLVYALRLKLSIGCSKFLFSHIDKIYLSLFLEYDNCIAPNNFTMLKKNCYHRKNIFQDINENIFALRVTGIFMCIPNNLFINHIYEECGNHISFQECICAT